MSFLSNIDINYLIYAVLFLIIFNGILILLKVKTSFIAYSNIFLLFIAIIEPSPSDILFVSFLILAIKDKIITPGKIKKQKMILFLLSGYVMVSILSSINMINLKVGAVFFSITLYLILYSLIIYFYSSDKNNLAIQRAYIFGTSISAVLGILGSMGFFSNYLCYDMLRVKGLFKDPNVYGPTFIPSILMLIGDIRSRKLTEVFFNKPINLFKKNISGGIFISASLIIVNLIGLMLSYSRGAYISFLIGLIVLFALNIKKINYKKFALYSLIMMSVIAFICFGIMNTRTRWFIMDRMGLQKYDLNRFEAQITGISMALDHITGYGPGQYEVAVNKTMGIDFSAHSLYARVILENGVPGFLLLMSVLFILLVKLLRVKKFEDDSTSIKSSVLIAAIISIMINSIIVDTLHWRHLWLILGLSLSVTMNCYKAGIVEFIEKIRPVYEQGSIKINIISSIEELKKYRDEWYDILNDDRCTPFTEFDFIINWWAFFKNRKHLFILRISKNEETIGFCPLIIEKKLFGNIIRFAGSPQANYMDFILDYENREKSIECIMNFLTNQRILLDLSGIPENSKNYKAVLKYLNNNKKKYFTIVEKAPLIKINTQNFENYYTERFNNHKRKEIKRRENKLRNIGKLTYGKVDMDNIDEIFSMHKKRWKKKLDESKFADENTKKFFTFLAEKNSLSFKTCIDAIKLNGNIVAFKYGFECRCRYVSYRICHDDDFALFGPGRIITKERLRECFDKGLELYDFGPGVSPYKAEWTDDYRNIMRIIFKGHGFYPNALFINRFLKYKVKQILKRNHSIVDFKEKKLGVLRYSISFENIKEKSKKIYLKVKKLGLIRSILAILIRLKEKIYSDEKYIIFSKDLTADKRNEEEVKSDFTFSEFDFSDIDELSRIMCLSKETIIKRIFENKKCFVAKKENKIVQYGWVEFNQIDIKEIKFSMLLREKSAYMFDGFTDPEYRSMGLSKYGLNYIAQYLINHNYNKCYVAANERNTPSVKSCSKAGFLPEIRLRGKNIMNKLKYFSIE